MGHPANRMPCNRCPDGLCRQEMISSMSCHRVRAMAALTVLNTRSQIPSRRPEHYLRGQRTASTAATERGPSAWAHPFEEGAIGCAVFDDGVYGARHPLPGRALRSNVPRGWPLSPYRPCDADAHCVDPSRCSARTCPESCWSASVPRSDRPSRACGATGHCRTSRSGSGRGTCPTARWRGHLRQIAPQSPVGQCMPQNFRNCR